jgi:hypothetical protein
MRIAMTTVLMMLAAVAWADEPSAPESKAEATAEASADKAAAPAAATETLAKADTREEKPFRPPVGYKPKRVNGELVYCMKTVILGSKFPVMDCRNEAQLKDLERTKRSMRNDMDRNRACVGGGCSAR